MTYFTEQTQSYIDGQIRSLDFSISYADSQDWIAFDKRDFKLRHISEARIEMLSVLTYANIYLKAITDAEYNRLTDQVEGAIRKREEKAWELVD